jgi:tetratricopeptide (TPR) repeat protein
MQIKGAAFTLVGRTIEGRALVEASLGLAERVGAGPLTARAAFTLSLALFDEDPHAAVEMGRRTVDLCRRFGLATLRLGALMNTAEVSIAVGSWAWLEAELDTVDRHDLELVDQTSIDLARAEIATIRGRDMTATVDAIRSAVRTMRDPQAIAAVAVGLGLVALAEGRFEDAIREVEPAERDDLNQPGAQAIAGRAAIRLGDRARARATLDAIDAAGIRGTAASINRDALAAGVAALEGRWAEATAGFIDAWRRYRDLRMDVGLAMSVLDFLAVAPAGDPLADRAAREARSILEREGATAYLAQLDELLAERALDDEAAVAPVRGRAAAARADVSDATTA